jgi:CMP/dCMP kinase
VRPSLIFIFNPSQLFLWSAGLRRRYVSTWFQPDFFKLKGGYEVLFLEGWEGFCILQKTDLSIEIHELFVHPWFRCQGFARQLLGAAIKRHEGRKLWLQVRRTNSEAIALYESYDFQKVGYRPQAYANGEGAWLMERFETGRKGPIVAIDGPAGTGKSSLTRRLAEGLGWSYMDTGAIYRAIGLFAQRLKQEAARDFHLCVEEGDFEKALAIRAVAEAEVIFRTDPHLNPRQRVFLGGEDVSEQIRTPEMALLASTVSAIPEVRAGLLGLQRRLGQKGFMIVEGRDIGTVVFPDAEIKFYLTANIDERAKRRLIELEALGKDTPPFEELRAQIMARDMADSSREAAPLRAAPGAIHIDTTTMTLEQATDEIQALIRQRIKA